MKFLDWPTARKVFQGIYGGLKNPDLMARKKKMEDEIRKKTKLKGEDYWDELGKAVDGLKKHAAVVTLAGPGGIKGNMVNLLFTLSKYEKDLGNA
jgi:hypothetical protein